MGRLFCAGGAIGGVLAAMIVLGRAIAPASAQQLNPDEAAMQVLNSANRAYNEERYPFAVERYREFIKLYAGHREAASAQYGLALALLELPEKDYKSAAEALQQALTRGNLPDRPFALYNMGVAQRGLGNQNLAQIAARPAEAANLRAAGDQNFQEAANYFGQAAAAFLARAKIPPASAPASAPKPAAPAVPPPPDLEWSARARCDQCEMLLRVGKYKEAGDFAKALLADPVLGKGRYRPLALYHLGHARFGLKDYLNAGKALSQLAPFQYEFGVHARYLLARVHHLSGERPEAAAQYKAVLAGYEEQKKAAQAALRNPAALKADLRAFCESVLNSPAPDYVFRSAFYLALMATEDGRHAEAATAFAALIAQNPKSPLIPEAQLRLGYCYLQGRNFPEAVKNLQPLVEHPQLSDQALWWQARAQAGSADPANPAAYVQVLTTAMETLRRAAAKAAELARTDPEAKTRRGDILMELADTQQLARQFKEAAATYQQVLGENVSPDRAEEAMQRQVAALHLAGQYRESDDLAGRFERTYPKSTLLPAVLFRAAENSCLTAAAAAGAAAPPSPEELKRLFGEAIARYQRLIKQYPEFQYVNVARQGLATAHHRLGHYGEVIAILTVIPEAERTGELATVPYVLADCLIRTLPAEADDALQAARLVEQAEQAAKLLETFLAVQAPNPQGAPPPAAQDPMIPDALLKLGCCYQRIGAVMIDPAERQKTLSQAREAYERSLRQYPADPARPTVVLERAKCLALLGDAGTATNELSRFRADPLKSSPVAPLAVARLAALLRAQNRAAEAVAAVADCRAVHEPALLKDPARADWAAMLQYEQALALKESGKTADARTMFEALAKQFPARPEAANAQWRAGQCRREELAGALSAARAAVAKAGARSEELAAANQAVADALKNLRQTADAFQRQAEDLGQKAKGCEAQLRMLYESAWCYRVLADAEIEAARAGLQREALDKVLARLAKEAPGQPPPALRPPEIPLSAIPVQPTEKLVGDQYDRLIAAGGESNLGIQGRLELAELLIQRVTGPEGYAPALALLADALEKNPPLDLAERIRLRLAACLLAKNDAKTALVQALAVLANPATAMAGEARYLAGQAYIQLKDWPKAIEQLLPLRDQGPLQNIPNVSDRGLMRLGYAYAQGGQWEPSRQTFLILTQRFPQSPWADQARYGIGWAWQSQKQFDNAVATYAEIVTRTAAEVAAQAQLQSGLCRLEQKRHPEAIKALLVVPLTYDYPECSAAAWCELGRAYMEAKQPAEAVEAWQRVVRDYPASPWAKVAQERLAAR